MLKWWNYEFWNCINILDCVLFMCWCLFGVEIMTEKRFELVWKDTGEVLHDNETGLDKGIYSPDYRFHVRDMMNELSDENEQLKQRVEQLENHIVNKLTIICGDMEIK